MHNDNQLESNTDKLTTNNQAKVQNNQNKITKNKNKIGTTFFKHQIPNKNKPPRNNSES